ncbi:hypothetical protein R3W88_017404 [Solanum pinnatisectum]|uniref:Uncharacterized protein n=1 Tax=Solanum pinnatisectum TaxID=50273 RepID=A0AAV9L050_9SOLN|nr:hypothetical protein R3W88_017404 [Solanum pinnatisectum]
MSRIPLSSQRRRTNFRRSLPTQYNRPHSWQALSFSVEVEGRLVEILVENPTFLAQVVSEGMRLAIETYNNHSWLSIVLQPPLSFPFPQISFYHHST